MSRTGKLPGEHPGLCLMDCDLRIGRRGPHLKDAFPKGAFSRLALPRWISQLWPGGCWEMSFNRGCRASLRVTALSLEVFVARVSAQPCCRSPTETFPESRRGSRGLSPGPHPARRHQCGSQQRPVPQVTGGSAPSHQAALLPAFLPISLGGEAGASGQAGPGAAAPQDGDRDVSYEGAASPGAPGSLSSRTRQGWLWWGGELQRGSVLSPLRVSSS